MTSKSSKTKSLSFKIYHIIESLLFLMIEIRLDIVFAISIVSRYVKNSSKTHSKTAKIILRYFNITKNREIIYENNTLDIVDYFDSDWIEDKNSRKFTSNFVFMLNDDFISWCFKRQSTIALSFTKIEYMTLTLAYKKVTWLKLLMSELSILDQADIFAQIRLNKNDDSAITLKKNNQSAIALANNSVLHVTYE